MPALNANMLYMKILNYDDMVHDGRIIIETSKLFKLTLQQGDKWVTAYLKENMKWEGPYAIRCES